MVRMVAMMSEGPTSTLRVLSAQQLILLKISTLRTLTWVPKSMASQGAGSASVWQRSISTVSPTSGPLVFPSMHLAARRSLLFLYVEDMVAVTGFSSGSALKGSCPTWWVFVKICHPRIHITQDTWCHANMSHRGKIVMKICNAIIYTWYNSFTWCMLRMSLSTLSQRTEARPELEHKWWALPQKRKLANILWITKMLLEKVDYALRPLWSTLFFATGPRLLVTNAK